MESATRATAPPAMGIEWSPEIACKHCDMKFGSAQALGGHQNAHRVDLEVAKRLRHAEFTGGRVTNVPERGAVESCTEEGTVGLCVWCMKSAPLKLCVNRPSASEIAWMMRNYRNIAQGPQQSAATAVKWSGGSINVGSLGARSGAAAARKYHGVENDEARAAALAARKYYKKDINEARAAAVAARKYYEKKNDETRASAVARGSSKRVVEELDLTLRL